MARARPRYRPAHGFWNGATPPLGYTIVEAERRGQKIKKKLAIDPVEAETVRLIFRETGSEAVLDPEKIAAFARLMRDVLENADNPTREACLRDLLNEEGGPEKFGSQAAAKRSMPQPTPPIPQAK